LRQKFGSLRIILRRNRNHVAGARLSIPSLRIDQDLQTVTKMFQLPAGTHSGNLIIHLTHGRERIKEVRFQILPDKENIFELDLTNLEEKVFLRPADSADRTVLAAEIKVEGVDSRFRPVRDWRGISYELKPGNYEVTIVLPDLRIRKVPLNIKTGIETYKLSLEDRTTAKRREQRVELTIPADYRAENEHWISTGTINISPKGACLLKKTAVEIDDYLYLRLLNPVSRFSVQCNGKVRWLDQTKTKMGLELFPTKTTEDYLRSWLQKATFM
jgi:hypothetical protein